MKKRSSKGEMGQEVSEHSASLGDWSFDVHDGRTRDLFGTPGWGEKVIPVALQYLINSIFRGEIQALVVS